MQGSALHTACPHACLPACPIPAGALQQTRRATPALARPRPLPPRSAALPATPPPSLPRPALQPPVRPAGPDLEVADRPVRAVVQRADDVARPERRPVRPPMAAAREEIAVVPCGGSTSSGQKRPLQDACACWCATKLLHPRSGADVPCACVDAYMGAHRRTAGRRARKHACIMCASRLPSA